MMEFVSSRDFFDRNTKIQKGQKIEERKGDYLQDLYGTPELTTTEYNQNYNAIKTEFWIEKIDLKRLLNKQ